MFFKRGKKESQNSPIQYGSLTALYFGEPVYEAAHVVLNPQERSLELFFSTKTYVLNLDRLKADYHADLCAAFLSRGRRCFGEDWPEAQAVLRDEQARRASSEGRLLPKEGVSLYYTAKDQSSILILLMSDVFLQMTDMMTDLQALLPETTCPRIEL